MESLCSMKTQQQSPNSLNQMEDYRTILKKDRKGYFRIVSIEDENFPNDFQDHMRNSLFTNIMLIGLDGNLTNCELLIRNESRRSVKLGNGWKKFASDYDLKAGDNVEFKWPHPTCNVVNVKKI